jgi:hypothetical protein
MVASEWLTLADRDRRSRLGSRDRGRPQRCHGRGDIGQRSNPDSCLSLKQDRRADEVRTSTVAILDPGPGLAFDDKDSKRAGPPTTQSPRGTSTVRSESVEGICRSTKSTSIVRLISQTDRTRGWKLPAPLWISFSAAIAKTAARCCEDDEASPYISCDGSWLRIQTVAWGRAEARRTNPRPSIYQRAK